jgi:hypothetical protein
MLGGAAPSDRLRRKADTRQLRVRTAELRGLAPSNPTLFDRKSLSHPQKRRFQSDLFETRLHCAVSCREADGTNSQSVQGM